MKQQGVADTLHSHFEKEEEYALPPLGLLSSLLSEEQVLYPTAILIDKYLKLK